MTFIWVGIFVFVQTVAREGWESVESELNPKGWVGEVLRDAAE